MPLRDNTIHTPVRGSPQPEAALPKSMTAYLAAFWERPFPQGAMTALTTFHLGRRDLSESHSPTCSPAWTPHRPVAGETGIARVLPEQGLLLRGGLERDAVGLLQESPCF